MTRLTVKTVQTELRANAPDITMRKTDCGEYRVTFTIAAIVTTYPQMSRNEAIAKAESLAAYETPSLRAMLGLFVAIPLSLLLWAFIVWIIAGNM